MDKQNGFNIVIEYRKNEDAPVSKRVYNLIDYTGMLRNNILKIIGDIEKEFKRETGIDDRNDWPQDKQNAFQNIRHNLLDCANSVQRIPQNLYYKGQACNQINMRDWLQEYFNATVNTEKMMKEMKEALENVQRTDN